MILWPQEVTMCTSKVPLMAAKKKSAYMLGKQAKENECAFRLCPNSTPPPHPTPQISLRYKTLALEAACFWVILLFGRNGLKGEWPKYKKQNKNNVALRSFGVFQGTFDPLCCPWIGRRKSDANLSTGIHPTDSPCIWVNNNMSPT